MTFKKNVLIVAGEPSGDLHASNLVKDLKRLNPNLKFFGIGGRLSKNAGIKTIQDIEGLALIGIVEVLKKIFIIRKVYKNLLERIDSEKVDLAILVDYPGFNLRLARELKRRSIPVVYYISPQVWAWGENRIKIIKGCVKKVVVFFKFEEELYRKNGVDAEFVGHPLLDIAKATMTEDDALRKYGLSKEKKTIALLPGSRESEVKTLLPIMVSSCKDIYERLGDLQFAVAKYPGLDMDLYKKEIQKSPVEIRVAEGDVYNILGVSDCAIVASGTATLETAIMGAPFVIIYKTKFLTFILYKLVARVRFLGLVNIIAGREIVPELLQSDATPEKIADKVVEILRDDGKRSRMLKELSLVKSSLGIPGASVRDAKAILPFLQ
jgi:lipid-A-disaccharide synthase